MLFLITCICCMILKCINVEYCSVCTGTGTGTEARIPTPGFPTATVTGNVGTEMGAVMDIPDIDTGYPRRVYGTAEFVF
ncbi:hypothetical protein AGABI1DRAFT_112907 [Agaricus bisporus var. burnettii JB137-S8]|uniref:Secreted protein n=1 Tax=Agaricus bisporus var. burnettii (strain JB137-S8 / ATCC MYA-4627 / FGSC 10392) TaxID=597362 RepID=K5XDJ3_AGABU|nr:hypothetical protein AGABI2DRAFT_192876 [Agaricus bisporus var. bisporus H97]XP_007328689.1 uncharacterized protein AGABI1DRAFT_112907 [Agaricus bisporus var. burnettii JB137-S8]EKM81227.1 hypothetical protein AGABI1DRAFT_112907 [Agaricus bisporus var. burnettii JB137-S8]EKV47717.1 hypothetical protein AGABI2DRAFT_192876 [Agaricus bisporus var. bisporus H97]